MADVAPRVAPEAAPGMIWALIILASAAAGELALRLPLAPTLASVLGASRKSARVLSSRRISEHWKEKVLLAYALRMGLGSLRFLALLAALLLPFLAVGLLAPGGLAAWSRALMQPLVMLLVCLVSVGWILLRLRVRRAARRA